MRLIRDGEKWGRGCLDVGVTGGGGRGRLYTYRYTVTHRRMIPALKWAAMREPF